MVTLYWDSGNPLDCFDNPNCFFDSDGIGKRREPGDPGYVVWFPPGYQPPPPKPKRKPLGRITSAQPNPNPSIAMPAPDDSFHYDVGPTTGGRWRPRATAQGKQSPAEHAAAVVAKCAAAGITLTVEQATAAISASWAETIDQAKRTVLIDYPGGYARMLPACGNSFPDPNFEGTYDHLAPDATTYLTRAGKLRFATDFSSTLGEVRSEKAAVVARVVCLANGQEDVYKVGKGQSVEGSDFGEMGDPATTGRPELTGTGVFYMAVADGTTTQVPWDSFISRKPSEMSWIVPAGLTGAQTLCLKVLLNGGIRNTLCGDPLSALP